MLRHFGPQRTFRYWRLGTERGWLAQDSEEQLRFEEAFGLPHVSASPVKEGE